MENASEYLIEYKNSAKCDEWLKKVIETFLQKSPEDQIENLAKDLLGISNYLVEEDEMKDFDELTDSVVLKELTHISGVNALANYQRIKFNPQVNIIYGLNGTGKSSYFRIMNEMLGGNNETPILSNIYLEATDPINVEMKFHYRGHDCNISWDGQSRGLPELKSMRVFDSEYTRGLLKKRDSDELVVKPYGLGIFADLILYIDTITEKANEILTNKENEKPQIITTNMDTEIAKLFESDSVDDEKAILIRGMLSSIEASEEIVAEKKAIVTNLQAGNPKDKIELLKRTLSEVNSIQTQLSNNVIASNGDIDKVEVLISEYIQNKKSSDEHVKQLEILKDIPGTDSTLWKEFISKGIDYSKENGTDIDECPFCHQRYTNHAKELVDAYVSFLDDKSQITLKNTETMLATKRSEIDKRNSNIMISDDCKIPSELVERIQSATSRFEDIRNKLLKLIDQKETDKCEKINLSKLFADIDEYKNKLQKEIYDLSTDVEGKNLALVNAEKDLRKAVSDFAISGQSKKIIERLDIEKWVEENKKKVASITPLRKNISTLSKKAHNELLTVQLQEEFVKNLNKLGVKNIDIELLGKNSNGVQQTELTIRKNKDITTILSEGEQKATAIALYLAEITLSKNKSTIIFDDPVNSLDHRMMQSLADLLMTIENQLIIFTHNKMFLDCFECTGYGHVCKTISSACNSSKGKHIYLYETTSEGKARKGVIVEKRVQNLRFYINEIEKMLAETPFTKFDDASIKLRRGVETAIDEYIFNNQTPTKLSNKNSRINWDALKQMHTDEELIEGLRQIHGRASGGELHNGSEREENPLDRDGIEELCNELKKLCNIT